MTGIGPDSSSVLRAQECAGLCPFPTEPLSLHTICISRVSPEQLDPHLPFWKLPGLPSNCARPVHHAGAPAHLLTTELRTGPQGGDHRSGGSPSPAPYVTHGRLLLQKYGGIIVIPMKWVRILALPFTVLFGANPLASMKLSLHISKGDSRHGLRSREIVHKPPARCIWGCQ